MNTKDFVPGRRRVGLGWLLLLLAATVAAAATTPAAAPANGTGDAPQNPFGPKPKPGTATAPAPAPAPAAASATGNEKFVALLRALLLQRFDKTHTGTLNAAEIAEARAVLSNGQDNRGPTPAQVARGGAAGPLFGLRPLIMQRFDKNGDGTLDADELAAIHQTLFGDELTAGKGMGGVDALRQEIVKQFDKNGDGQLDETERAAALMFLRQMTYDLEQSAAAKPPADTKSPVVATGATPPHAAIPAPKAAAASAAPASGSGGEMK